MFNVKAYGTTAADKLVAPMTIPRRDLGPQDVLIDIAFCGVCHSDIHQARGEWAGTLYPCVPGHEIVGHVAAVGAGVTGFKPGDTVGVGCMVDSCQNCPACNDGFEQYCVQVFTGTYNFPTKDAPGHTLGGYAQKIVVNQKFVLRIRHPADQLAAVAPLLCAGITTYSPLRHWKVGPGKKVGIVGIGGLGHVGLKLARAMGAHTVALTTSDAKRTDALRLGADEVIITRDAADMANHRASFDFILNTVAASHSLDPYIELLKNDCTMALVGAPANRHPSPDVSLLVMKRRSIAGSLIGGIAETQEMLDFCAERGIVSDIEMIGPEQIEPAYSRILASDVKYRFVVDMATL